VAPHPSHPPDDAAEAAAATRRAPGAGASPSDTGLLRGISRPLLVAVLVNAVIGAGILGLPGRAYAVAGAWSLLAWVLCAVLMSGVALCFAEVSSRFTQTGGPYLYARVAFGPTVAFVVGWVMWVTRPLTIAVIGNLLVGYTSALWPAAASGTPRFAVITAFMAALTAVLVAGIRETAFVSTAFTIGKVLVLGVFVAAGLPAMEWERIAVHAAPDPDAIASATLLIVFAYAGFEIGAVVAGEIGNPRRDLPAATMAALAIVAALFILVQLVAIGTAPSLASLATSERPLAEAAAVFLGPIVGRSFAFVALMLLIGTMLTTLLLGTRMLYALGEQEQLPPFFARVHPRTRTPIGSTLVTCGVAYVATLFSTFATALVIATSTRVLTYLVSCVALPVLRRRADVPAALFRVRAGDAVAVACTLLLVYLLLQSSWVELATLAAVSAVGLLPWALTGRRRSPGRSVTRE
jgi:amino acid transporter